MPYHIQAETISIESLQEKIVKTDLVPSRKKLLENIDTSFAALKKSGIQTLADLRKALKNVKQLPAFATKTNTTIEYLTLLRREIEGYFPKAAPLSDFNWILDTDTEAKLKSEGITNCAQFFEQCDSEPKRKNISIRLHTEKATIDALFGLSDLNRVQWTSPLFARMLFEAGYTSAKKVACADPESLYTAVNRHNQEKKLFKGTIGLRDIQRLIHAAQFIA